jgi:hypothetical protein
MKPIVFLVDRVESIGEHTFIKTAYETINERLPNRSVTIQGWGNPYLVCNFQRGCFEPTLTAIPEITFESLADSSLDKDATYIYLIPCKTEIDVGEQTFANILPSDLLTKIAVNNVSVLFDYSYEVYEFPRFGLIGVERWREALINKNKSYSKPILVSSANYICPTLYPRHICRFINLPMRAIVDRRHYSHLADIGKQVNFSDYLTKEKPYLFLNLNMQPRQHRVYFVKRLILEDLQGHGLVSFMSDAKGDVRFMVGGYNIELSILTSKVYGVTPIDLKVLADTVHGVGDKLSIDDDILIEAHDQNSVYNSQWAIDTCFDIISETGSFAAEQGNSPVLSEKTFKSIYYNRPFMINGDKGNLKMLHRLGFRTFPELFNESYDDYNSMFDRHQLLVENIRSYSNNYSQFMDKVAGFQSVIEHNYNLLMTPGSLERSIVTIINQTTR